MTGNSQQVFSNKDLKLRLPFGLLLAGPSSSGKSTFIRKLIDQSAQLIYPPPKSILYAYGEYSALVTELQRQGINVYAGVPPDELIQQQPKPALIILDDLLYAIEERHLSELFTKKSHHQNFAILFVSQDLFQKKLKTARQNSQYIAVMRSPNAALALRNLGIQLFPRQLDFFLDAYRQATRHKYSYLFIDLHPASDPILRLRTNIFKDEGQTGDEGGESANATGDASSRSTNEDDNIKATIFLPKGR